MTLRFLLALAMLAGSATIAHAAGKPSAADARKARTSFAQGKVFYEKKLYKEAIKEYQAAYAAVPDPVLIFNIGLAQEGDGDLDGALASYRKYLELDPAGVVADEARNDVARLTAAAEEQHRKAAADKAAEDERQRQAAAAAADKAAADKAATDKAAAEVAQHEAARQHAADLHTHAKHLRWTAYVTAGLGLVSVGVGIKFGLEAKDISDSLTNHQGAWTTELLARQSDFAPARNTFYLLEGVGVACVLGAGFIYYLGHRADAEADGVTIVPTATEHGAGLSLAGSF